jgi:subtilisin family serine protease
MTDVERAKIISEDYADLFIRGQENINRLSSNTEATLSIINRNLGVNYIPVTNMTQDSVIKFGYQNIPKCYGLLSLSSIEASGINNLRKEENFDLRGNNVLIGFVDTGIEYNNSVFKNADGTTRIVSIWDQGIDSEYYPKDFFYGTEYSREDINRAINAVNPLLVVPSTDEYGHGTMLAGVAAGNPSLDNRFTGVAVNAEMVVVKLKPAKKYLKEFFRIPEYDLCYQENDIIMGIEYLVGMARQLGRPIAICIGVGSSQGAHDGEGVLCRYLNDLGQQNGIGIVIAAGNEGNENHHFYGEVNPSLEYDIVTLNVGTEESGFSMELWGFAPNIVEVDIYAPTGDLVTKISGEFLQKNTIQVEYNQTTIYIDNIFSESSTGGQLILFRFLSPVGGPWRFVVSGKGDLTIRYHIWLPISNFLSSNTFFLNADNDTTLSIPANAINAVTVSAYNNINSSLFYYTSRGFTRSNGLKPDVAAPGVNIVAPALNGSFYRFTGTGAAAAHTTGIVALILEWGIVNKNFENLNNIIIRRLLVRGAKRNPQISYPNEAWGFGMVDIYRTFQTFHDED